VPPADLAAVEALAPPPADRENQRFSPDLAADQLAAALDEPLEPPRPHKRIIEADDEEEGEISTTSSTRPSTTTGLPPRAGLTARLYNKLFY